MGFKPQVPQPDAVSGTFRSSLLCELLYRERDRRASLSSKGVLGACWGVQLLGYLDSLILRSHCLAFLFPKVKPSREKRSLASRLSGYIPPKKKQGQSSSLPTNGESLNCTEDRVLSTVAILTLN